MNNVKIEVWVNGYKEPSMSEEYCPHCETFPAIENIPYKRQLCPNCKKIILACNVCDHLNCALCSPD